MIKIRQVILVLLTFLLLPLHAMEEKELTEKEKVKIAFEKITAEGPLFTLLSYVNDPKLARVSKKFKIASNLIYNPKCLENFPSAFNKNDLLKMYYNIGTDSENQKKRHDFRKKITDNLKIWKKTLSDGASTMNIKLSDFKIKNEPQKTDYLSFFPLPKGLLKSKDTLSIKDQFVLYHAVETYFEKHINQTTASDDSKEWKSILSQFHTACSCVEKEEAYQDFLNAYARFYKGARIRKINPQDQTMNDLSSNSPSLPLFASAVPMKLSEYKNSSEPFQKDLEIMESFIKDSIKIQWEQALALQIKLLQ